MTPLTVDLREKSTETTGFDYDLWKPTGCYAPQFMALINKQLDRLAKLEPGWNAEGAKSIDQQIIEAARVFAASLPENLVSSPTVVPMAKGNLQFEWHNGPRSLELEMENPTTVHYLKWDSEGNVEEEDFFDIHDVSQAEMLLRWFLGGVTYV